MLTRSRPSWSARSSELSPGLGPSTATYSHLPWKFKEQLSTSSDLYSKLETGSWILKKTRITVKMYKLALYANKFVLYREIPHTCRVKPTAVYLYITVNSAYGILNKYSKMIQNKFTNNFSDENHFINNVQTLFFNHQSYQV